MKRLLALLLLAGLLLCSTGCLSAQSLERYGYVLAIGFDRGEQLPYSVTLLIQKTQTDSESQNNSGFLLVKAECNNLLEGIATLSAGLPLQVNLSRTAMIVVEIGLLMEQGQTQAIFDLPFSRLYIRYNTALFASISPAYDMLEGLSNELDPNPSRINMNIGSYSQKTGLIPLAHLSLLVEALDGQTYDLALPLCGITSEEGGKLATRDSVGTYEYAYIGGSLALESEMKTSLAGAALLRDGLMVGFLDGQNVQLLLMATGDFQEGRRLMQAPDGKQITVYLSADQRPKTNFSLVNGQARAHMTIPISVYVETAKKIESSDQEVAAAIERALTRDMAALFDCCRKLGSDVMGFGKHAVSQFQTVRAWEEFNWRNAYMQMDAQFLFEVKLLHRIDAGLE